MVNHVGLHPEHQGDKPKSANQECNSGTNPQSSQEFPTEERRHIENVAHSSTNSPILTSQVAQLIDLTKFTNSVPRGTLFGFLNFVARLSWQLPVFAMALTARAACGVLEHSKRKASVVLLSPISFALRGTRCQRGESCFSWNIIVHGQQ